MRTKIVDNALTWYNTPYHHHARIKGVGVDCAQLIVGVAVECNIITDNDVERVPNYPIQWHLHNKEERLLSVLESFGCVEIDRQDAQMGDIVAFRFGRVSSHLGIIVNDTQFIHAHCSIGKVVINTLSGDWDKRWEHTYRFPGVI